MKSTLKVNLVNVASDPKRGIMSATDTIKYFAGWIYAAGLDRFVKHEPKAEHGVLTLTPDAFDRYLGGHLFHVGLGADGASEFTASASYAFTQTRVASFPKIISPELESALK